MKNEIATAQILGTIAFKNGTPRSPFQDSNLMNLIKGNEVGNPANTQLMLTWIRSWDDANIFKVN